MSEVTVIPTASPARHRAFSLVRIWALAANTLLDLIRQKVFYFLIVFALVLIGCSCFMDFIRPELQFQVIKDVSLGAMSIFTWLLSVLATAMLLPKDIEDRTLYTILAKPVPRFEYLLGKLGGVLLLLAVSTVLMGAMFSVVLYAKEQFVVAGLRHEMAGNPAALAEALKGVYAGTFSGALVAGIIAIYLKAAIFAALTLFISTFASSYIFTVVISVAVYLIGHLVPMARDYCLSGGGGFVAKATVAVVALLFPDLQLFNLTDDIVAGNAIPLPIFLHTCGLGFLYIAVYTCAAYFTFAKKEL
ncbi:MAG: ABC transporter permease [Chthoniobacteraceae bacterium]